MTQALSQHAEEAYDELATERRRAMAEKIFKALTDTSSDPRGVRRPASLRDLCAVADADEAEVTDVIDRFRKPGRSFPGLERGEQADGGLGATLRPGL